MTLTRQTPLKAKRVKPRAYKTPRCDRQGCKKPAKIQGWCESHAEREADRLFSLWVRRRDGRCTAAEVLTETECRGIPQAAHIEGRRKQSVRFDPANVHQLCSAHHVVVDQHASHAAKARWAISLLGPDGYHELIERAAVTLPRAVAVERALSWLKDET